VPEPRGCAQRRLGDMVGFHDTRPKTYLFSNSHKRVVDLTQNNSAVRSAIRGHAQSGSGTAIFDTPHDTSGGYPQLGQRITVLMTDGADTASSSATESSAIQRATGDPTYIEPRLTRRGA